MLKAEIAHMTDNIYELERKIRQKTCELDDLEFEKIDAIGPAEENRPYLDLNAVAEQISRPPFNIRVSESFRPTGYAKQARTFTKSVGGEDRKVTVFDNATEEEIKAAMKFLETGLKFPIFRKHSSG